MGTNYYTITKTCPTCGNKPDGIHLGKSSVGWQFSFQYNGGQYYKSVSEMKEWLKNKQIETEYGEIVSQEVFWKMVESKQNRKNQNHAEYAKREYPNSSHKELIIDGYSFSDYEFS